MKITFNRREIGEAIAFYCWDKGLTHYKVLDVDIYPLNTVIEAEVTEVEDDKLPPRD